MKIAERKSACRVPLPSRAQIQRERKRLERKAQSIELGLRKGAALAAVFLLFGTLCAVCFSVLRVSDDALQPVLLAGDHVLVFRSDSAQRGTVFAYKTAEGCILCGRQTLEDAESGTKKPDWTLLGRALLSVGRGGKIHRLS